eukprot:PhF_6_TR12725/c0_g1_i1/m.20168
MVNPGVVNFTGKRPPHRTDVTSTSADGNTEDDNKTRDLKEESPLGKPDRSCPKLGRTGCCVLGAVSGGICGAAFGAYAGIVATKAAVHQQLVGLLGPKLA